MTEPDNYSYTEYEFLDRLRQGDENLLASLFHKHYPTLMTYAQRMVSFEVAQDLISESFIKCWKNKDQFRSEAALYQWLKITVRNASLNQLRNVWRTQLTEPEKMIQLEQTFEQDLYEAAVESGLFARIVATIEDLPPQQQRIIRLFFIDGKNNATIASELNISVQAVKNQKLTALKILRKNFSPDDLVLCLAAVLGAVK